MHLKRRLHILAQAMALLAALFLVAAQPAVAAPPNPGTNWGKNVNAGACEGTLVINVTHDVTNDGDSGVTRFWAYDNYRREIQVWQVDDDTFCAVVRYEGQFTTTVGASPMNTGTVPAGQTGTFAGGYRATIDGALNGAPAHPSNGFIGSFDYGWDSHDAHGAHTPFSWVGTYFSAVSDFTYEWWGWVYKGGACGTWYNTSDGNAGDIACP